MKMTAKRNFSYRGRALKAGQEFQPRDKTHARQLRQAGMASDVKPGRKAKVEQLAAVTSPAAQLPSSAVTTAETLAENTYSTRVLKAED